MRDTIFSHTFLSPICPTFSGKTNTIKCVSWKNSRSYIMKSLNKSWTCYCLWNGHFCFIINLNLNFRRTESKSWLVDLDLEEAYDTGYEQLKMLTDVLPPNVTFTNDNVRRLASYQMKLFWHCCLQRGSAVELLNYGKLKRKLRKGLLYDWLSTRCPVKPKRVRQVWKFYKHFFNHIKKSSSL